MATGSSQKSAKQTTGLLTLAMVPNASGMAGGLVVVNCSSSDDLLVDLPNASGVLLNGRAFAGIMEGFNTTVVGSSTQTNDNQITVQRDGIAKALLKINTACVAEQPAAYDPADGGYVVPYTNQKQVLIGKFTQSKSSSASPQFVGVELTPGAAGVGSGGLLLFADPQAGTASSMAENAYSNATLTIPANFLRAGDVIEYSAALSVTNQNAADTLIIRFKIGSTTIVQTVATYNPATLDTIVLRGFIGVDDIGATATPNCAGTITYGAAATAAVSVAGVVFPSTDTTAAVSITLTAQWSASSADNVVDLKSAYAVLHRKAA